MPTKVFWIVRDRVIYMCASGDVTLNDIGDMTQSVADHMDEAYLNRATLIVGMVDLREANLSSVMRSVLSTSVSEISNVIDSRLWKAKPGFIVLLRTSDAAKTIISLIVQISKQPMTTVGTLSEGLTVVSYMYPELQEQLNAYRDGLRSAGTS